MTMLVLLFGWRHPDRLWRTSRPVFQLARSLLMFVMPFSFLLALGLVMWSRASRGPGARPALSENPAR